MRFDKEIDTTIFSKVKDSIRLYNYEDLLLENIDNIEFSEKNKFDYLIDLKTKKVLLYHTNDYFQNGIGLYNVCGNAAEMINDKKKTKGGSWLSYAYFIQIKQFEPYDGNPSPTVGCRIFMEVVKN